MDGVLRCSRYAFGPNQLHYCGPDATHEIRSYINDNHSDPGLNHILKAFQTLYPYLCYIAQENNIQDPFNEKVVEAYWIGNKLLENIEKKTFYQHLLEEHKIKKRLGAKSFERIVGKISSGAVPHHSFHVLDIWKRTGHVEKEHTLESMDSCRISWGTVIALNGPVITISSESLAWNGHILELKPSALKQISRTLDMDTDIEQLKIGDIITVHWGVPCEIITKEQAVMLKKYTLRHIALANKTL